MAIFDELVLKKSLITFAETLHALLYEYGLALIPSGVSVASPGVADDPWESNVAEPFFDEN